MEHYDDDVLALLALGESIDTADPSHLQTCEQCRRRLEELSSTVAIARSIGPDDQLQTPPGSVWAGIQNEILEPAPNRLPASSGSSSATNLADARRSRSARIWVLVAAAAVIGVLAGGIVTARIVNPAPTQNVVATGNLASVGASNLSGTAQVSEGVNGNELTVDIPGLPALNDGYYEVWMATPDAKTMVAVGTVSPGQSGIFNLPAGMNIADFSLVDVSIEHFDGNPAHSADSVVRGQLGV